MPRLRAVDKCLTNLHARNKAPEPDPGSITAKEPLIMTQNQNIQ